MIVMADYLLADNPDNVVIGVDADGLSYVLQPGGGFTVSTEDFSVVRVRRIVSNCGIAIVFVHAVDRYNIMHVEFTCSQKPTLVRHMWSLLLLWVELHGH